jgi:integrase
MASIKRRPDGTWRARYRTSDGRERSKHFKRKLDAERWVSSQVTDRARGVWVDDRRGRETFAAFVDTSFRQTMVGLEPSTRATNESYLRTHVLPAFGHMQLAAIDYAICQAWVNELTTRKAPSTVVKAAQIMSKVMKVAVRSRLVPHNPMTDVDLPTIRESDDIYLTPAQVKDLAEAMTEVAPRYRALVWIGCYAGPRIGELAALRWGDFDPLRRTVAIVRKSIEVAGVGVYEGPTKTKAGRRTVTLPRPVADEIERHRRAFAADTTDLVFTSPGGAQIRPHNLRRREWATAVSRAGLDGFTFHDMRHTAVSLWVAAGASDLEVAKWAGHRSPAFTKTRYAHLFPEHGEALAARLEIFFETATGTPAAPVVALRGPRARKIFAD